VAPPTASITTPVNGATYTHGQFVASSFSCSEGTGGPGIASCLDQNGRAPGAAIDTSTAGPHTLTITATSSDGQTGTASVAYTVAAAPTTSATSPASTPTSTAPSPPSLVLGDLKQSHPRWREPGGSAQITNHRTRFPVGTAFSFTLNEAATVKLVLIQTASGRVVKLNGKRQCVAHTKGNRRMRNCTRTVTVATLSLTARGGADKMVFDGRVSPTRRLRPGRYTVTITATNASGASSRPQSLRFTIVG
jgi:hypothetical protein